MLWGAVVVMQIYFALIFLKMGLDFMSRVNYNIGATKKEVFC